MDIGAKPYLIASSLILVGAQRLVRILCPDCKEPYAVDDQMKRDYGLQAKTVYRAKGCKKCRNIGYWGRIAIYEMLPIDEKMRHEIATRADVDVLRRMQKERGHTTLLKSGLKKVEEGLTSIEEVLSVAYE